jgi:hypothetical protein
VKHYSEEDLILHFYGDSGGASLLRGARLGGRSRAIAEHIDQCPDCAERYRDLATTLNLLEAPEVPERGEQYGLEVWQRIRARLPEPEPPWWVRWLRWDRLAAAGAVSMLVVAAFLAGRMWTAAPQPASPAVSKSTDAGNDGRRQILLTSLAEHLDRSERVLTEIMNAPEGGDISSEQRWAEDLVSASRLYRQEAIGAGEQSVASVLDDLERNLLEVVHSPAKVTAADLDAVRRRIDAAALLFKVRVLGDELRQRQETAPAAVPHAQTISSHSS